MKTRPALLRREVACRSCWCTRRQTSIKISPGFRGFHNIFLILRTVAAPTHFSTCKIRDSQSHASTAIYPYLQADKITISGKKEEKTLTRFEPQICNAIRNWPQSSEIERLVIFSTAWRSQIWSMSVYFRRIYNMTVVQYMLPCLSWSLIEDTPSFANAESVVGRFQYIHTF